MTTRAANTQDLSHDFGRPWGTRRKDIYIWTTVAALVICVVPFAGVVLHWWDAEPAGFIAAALICGPIIIPMVVAWWDDPGETRTMLERFNEFMIVWIPITASSQVLWEITWLIGDLLGHMNLTAEDRWGWFWYFYGAADTRYLISDAGLFGMETVAAIGGCILLYNWLPLLRTKDDDRRRIRILWWCYFAFAMMTAVIIIYYVAEARDSFANIEQGFWGFALKFVFMNIPWMVAPVVSMLFIPKMMAVLYQRVYTGWSRFPQPTSSDPGARQPSADVH
ncbi:MULTISPECIES: Emopamil-binding protein [unclassified Dietzia]|uniref:Emopamil-binding protein n=1 Tax=unclassified Dietzia TaxID=2617939 RepID=UPI0015F8399D|nr:MULTISPECIES: Emopamil-binding protein [unclassified Dietzia]MBB1023216.1 Emopamil-binding protein [Dietzia sp. DQ12-76]MBB1029094.1 Emopamil-binding protein [Dietzia sp. DQ11-38-2]